jgi:hypothetical protein
MACPVCKKQTFFNEGGVKQCTKCKATGWAWNDPVEPGQGMGKKCPNCAKQTLHAIAGVVSFTIRRCSTCSYCLVAEEG